MGFTVLIKIVTLHICHGCVHKPIKTFKHLHWHTLLKYKNWINISVLLHLVMILHSLQGYAKHIEMSMKAVCLCMYYVCVCICMYTHTHTHTCSIFIMIIKTTSHCTHSCGQFSPFLSLSHRNIASALNLRTSDSPLIYGNTSSFIWRNPVLMVHIMSLSVLLSKESWKIFGKSAPGICWN